jgi:hypothetical protein
MAAEHIFAYGFLSPPLTMYVEQRGTRFNIMLSRADSLGLKATTRPVLWTTYPGRGNARTARRWFKAHARQHNLNLTFDR